MKAKKFELFMGCLGNGTTVCNKAVMENGDYKFIAHISTGGNIKLFVPPDYIPPEEMQKIQTYAVASAEGFKRKFESLNAHKQYGIILDSANHSEFMEIMSDKRPLLEKLPELRERYYKRA